MSASLIDVAILDDSRKHLADGGSANQAGLSALCDEILDGFATCDWYQRNVPYGPPDKYERAMLKTFLGWLLTQKTRMIGTTEGKDVGTSPPVVLPTAP